MQTVQRHQLSVQGQVQGVGFRPFVYHLATQLQLTGCVVNDGSGVKIEVQGNQSQLENFQRRLLKELPPLAIIDEISCEVLDINSDTSFSISVSKSNSIKIGITPDTAICLDCLSELFDKKNRRFLHPFINCTNCGTRYTIVNRLPYDRVNTTMSAFGLCAECDKEYHNPTNRRFHAQPVCCQQCGPELIWENSSGEKQVDDDPIGKALACIQQGGIVAIKGVGGFHLVCDARNKTAVENLRLKKQRKSKPFAVMACNCESLKPVSVCNDRNAELLSSQAAPIVLLPKTQACDDLIPGIAPGLNRLGVMLPYTPIHYLLFHAAAVYPVGAAWLETPQDLLLVMTSANATGEPLLIDNDSVVENMADIVDGYLLHDREIKNRCDDSVIVGDGSFPSIIRRGRGLAPQAVKLQDNTVSILAVGGFLKNTICLSRDNNAYLSPYIGDLSNAECCRYFDETVANMQQLFQIEPQQIVRDCHPDFYSSQFAEALAAKTGCEVVEVQHHHAHCAAVVAEHQLTGPVIGLALDGLGLGSDGNLWGGELLHLEGAGFERLGNFKHLQLPGGDKATKEPWRIAAGVLHTLGRGDEVEHRFSQFQAAPTIIQMLDKQLSVQQTSSAGRLFDAAAALLGVQLVTDYEAQASMMLESLLEPLSENNVDMSLQNNNAYYHIDEKGELDFYPLLSAMADEPDMKAGAQLFHEVLVAALSEWAIAAVKSTGIDQIVFSGGCFLNTYLRDNLYHQLTKQGITVYQAENIPCNDSGLSLGQLWVAQRVLKNR